MTEPNRISEANGVLGHKTIYEEYGVLKHKTTSKKNGASKHLGISDSGRFRFSTSHYWFLFVAVILLLTSLSCGSLRTVHDESLSILNMPVLLWVGADAVVRHDERLFEVTRPNRGRLHVHRTVTVMNRDGRAHTRVFIPYDPYRKPGNFKGAVYDRNGKRVRTLRRSDIEDNALVRQQNWYTDYRYKRFQLMHDEYPYTVTYSYTIDYRQLLNWPQWTPQPRGTSVQHAEFVLRIADGIHFRTRESHLEATGDEKINKPVIQTPIPEGAAASGGLHEYRWEISNRFPIRVTRGGLTYAERQPELRISGADFEVDGYAGSLRNWEDFAGWIRLLYSENMELADRDRERVREITSTSSDTLEIIRRLYQHVQEYTRYVNVSLGIGGWKPFPPNYVYENRHGDCKALTQYLFVLLKEAGISSRLVLVQSQAGRSTVDPDFPENAFNHVFLAIPHGDSPAGNFLWMEATSRTMPAGYAGRNNSERYGLMITEDGGGMVWIPGLGSDENRIMRSGVFDLDESGNIRGALHLIASGYPHERIRNAGHFMNTRDQQQFLDSRIGWTRTRIRDFEIHADSLLPEAGYKVHLEQAGFASRSGNRLFVTAPRPVHAHPRIPDQDADAEEADSSGQDNGSEHYTESDPRQHEPTAFRLDMTYTTTDSLVFRLPEGFRVEALPEPWSLDTKAASGRFEWRLDKASHPPVIIMTKDISIRQKEFSEDDLPELRGFFQELGQQVRRPLVLVRD